MAGEIDFGILDPNAVYKGAANMNALLEGIATKKAGGMLASGDSAGASKTLMQSGQIDAGVALQDRITKMSTAQHERSAQMIKDTADALDNIGQTQGYDKVVPAFDHLTPMFKNNGMTDDEIAQTRASLAQDPKGFLTAMSTHTAKHLEQFSLAPGQNRYDATGKLIASSPGEHVVAPGGTLVETGGMQQPPAGETAPAPQVQGDATTSAANPTPSDAMFPQGIDHAAVRKVESNNDPNAVSRKGATGLMQTMPQTLQNPGYNVKPAVITADMTPQQVAAEKQRVGDDYLDAMQKKYDNPSLALMAYNWGPDNVDKWLAGGGQMNKVPRETREYLGKVAMAHAVLSKTPAAPVQAADAGSGARVVFRNPANQWRDLTPAEKVDHPNGDQINDVTHQIRNVAGGAAATPLDPDSVHMLAIQLLTDGKMPSVGMNNAPLRNAVAKDAAATLKRLNRDPRDIAGFAAEYKGATAALADQNKRIANISGYEGTVQDAIKLVQQNEGALANTGFSAVNMGVNWWKKQSQDPGFAALQNSIDSVVNEYSKVISNATAGGVTSDAARNKAEAMLTSANDAKALESQINIMKQEMDFRVKNMMKQRDMLVNTVHHILPPDPAPQKQASNTAKARTWNPQTGKLE